MKKRDNENLVENKEINENKTKKKSIGNTIKNIFIGFALIISIAYYIIYIKDSFNHINYVKDIINATLLLITVIFLTIALICNKTLKNIFGALTAFIIVALLVGNILFSKNIINLPTLETMKDFTNMSLIETMEWTKKHNIDLIQIYEFSDNIKEGNIISQDIFPNTIVKKIKKLNVVVSNGPDFNKELILTSLVGTSIDDLIKYINANHLSNVTINYELNDEVEKDKIISQSVKGQIKRNDLITITISLGNKDSLKIFEMENLKNKTLFEASLYLKKNGVNYNTSYEFSDTIKKGCIIDQSIKQGNKVTPLVDTIDLVISKGKKIIVPDFTNKDVNDVIKWVTDNKLSVSFIEEYNIEIPSSKLIKINYNSKDIIEENTKIIITTSKGALKVPNISSIADFTNWANANGVNYVQQYSYSDSVKKGNIINISIPSGTKIDPAKDSIAITISYGSPITVPNFIGNNINNIKSKCSSIGLSCSFYYTGYSNTQKDLATTQSITAGNKVVSGSSLKIGLSNGPAKTYNIYIQAEWIQSSADATINTLKSNLNSSCSGVTFNFIKKAHNSAPQGFIHPESPVQGGNNNFVQGKTYTIWIVE